MSRLPVPGNDNDVWGAILNDFLSVEHTIDGKLKIRTDGTLSDLYSKPAGGIPQSDLSGAVQSVLDAAGTAVQSVNGKTGTSVTLAASDVGAPTTIAGLSDVNTGGVAQSQVLAYDAASGKWLPSTVSSTVVADATNLTKGLIQLSGDLAGSNDATQPTIAGSAITSSKIAPGAISDTHISSTAAIAKSKLAPLGIVDADVSSISQSKITGLTTALGGGLQAANNLSDVGNTGTARTNLGLGTAATKNVSASSLDIQPLGITAPGSSGKVADAAHVHAMPRLDQVSTPTASVNFGGQKITNVANGTGANDVAAFGQIPVAGTTGGTYAAGNDSRITGAEQTANKGVAGGYASLGSDGKLVASQLPSLSVSTTYVVNSQAAMLALAAHQGDVAVRTDLSETFILTTSDPTQLGNWQQLLTAASVTSVNGQTGNVTIPNAASNVPGLVELTGDLGGSYNSPTVAKVNGVTLPGTSPTSGQVLTATGSSAAAWQTPAAGISLDSTAADIQPLGTQAAGSIGKAADAGHVHAMPRLDQVGLPTAAVALNAQKITGLANGTASTDAAAFGQIPTVGAAGSGAGNALSANDPLVLGAVQSVNGIAPSSGALTITPAQISPTIAVVAMYSSGEYPLRNTITTNASQTVIWLGPVAPPIGGGYALNGVDIWDQTVS